MEGGWCELEQGIFWAGVDKHAVSSTSCFVVSGGSRRRRVDTAQRIVCSYPALFVREGFSWSLPQLWSHFP